MGDLGWPHACSGAGRTRTSLRSNYPGIGDNFFDLYLLEGTDYVFEAQLAGGIEYRFDADGVERFRILGIATAAGLDPYNPIAFITGITFTDSGEFTGTMIPITTDVNL